jgi:hypothetical protein
LVNTFSSTSNLLILNNLLVSSSTNNPSKKPDMRKNPTSQSGFFNPRVLFAFTLCSVGVFLAALGFATTPTPAGWSLITSPNVGASANILKDVTCASASDCWAVGDHSFQTLIEHWNGSSWTVVPSPNVSASATQNYNNFLDGVACASASDCWAVGKYWHANGIFDTYYQAVIQHWDGTAWTIFSLPAQPSALSDVTCVSASDCWAVGSSIQHWDGTSWALVNSPSGGGRSVTCASASECWVVGDASIQRWDGTSWVNVPYIYPSDEGTTLEDVACASASDCWVVGFYPVGEEENQSFIEHWDGTSWTIVPAPNPGGTNALTGVTCASASECWAIGTYIERWDGSSWSIVPSPNPTSGTQNLLERVTCASTSECWVVGYTSGSLQTVIEEFAPTIPPLVGVVSRKVHGGAGTFDIDLPLTATSGVECRSPGATGTPGVDYKLVFSFVNNVTSCGTASIGSLSSGPNSNQCTVNLTGVTNQQYIAVTLNNVLDSQNNTGTVSTTMGVLIGDTNASGAVNSSDISQTKAQSGTAATATNFRTDVSVNGLINASDISTVKSKSGTDLP